jgi:hypothetical protein
MLLRLLASILCIALIGACSRFSEAKLTGTWRYEDEDGIQEITLQPDRSFWSQDTFKKELVTPSPLEETGMWRVEGDQLILDATITWSKERRQISKTLVQITKDTWVTKSLDQTKSLTYTRLVVPVCTAIKHAVSKAELLGSWQTHYNTHDYQYRFMPNDRFGLFFASMSGEWDLLFEGKWRIGDSRLIIKPEKARYGETDSPEETWTITVAGADCFAMKAGSSRLCTLRRLK